MWAQGDWSLGSLCCGVPVQLQLPSLATSLLGPLLHMEAVRQLHGGLKAASSQLPLLPENTHILSRRAREETAGTWAAAVLPLGLSLVMFGHFRPLENYRPGRMSSAQPPATPTPPAAATPTLYSACQPSALFLRWLMATFPSVAGAAC